MCQKIITGMEQLAIIKEKAGLAPFTLLHCPECSTVAQACIYDLQYGWCSQLQCGNCVGMPSWWICRRCPNQRSIFQSRPQVTRHHRLKHKDDPVEPVARSSSAAPPFSTSVSSSAGRLQELPLGIFSREASQRYFSYVQDDTGATNRIVAQAVFKNTSVARNLHSDDVRMIMSMSTLIDTLTRTQRENLAGVLQLAVSCTRRQLGGVKNVSTAPATRPTPKKLKSSPSLSHQWDIPVPCTKESLRSIFLDGKSSIKENIPHPCIKEDVTGHAYILPSECLVDCMAHGFLDHNVSGKAVTYARLPSSTKAQELAAKDLTRRTIYLSLWCDDFEPNYSIKGGRGSVWLLTLTLESSDSGPTSIHHVYPIAVGLKGTDHNPVLRTLWEDLRSLSTTGKSVFNGYERDMEEVRCEVIAWTMDQPENRGCNGLLLGGSTSFARFGYALDIAQIQDKIRPCRTCFSAMASV